MFKTAMGGFLIFMILVGAGAKSIAQDCGPNSRVVSITQTPTGAPAYHCKCFPGYVGLHYTMNCVGGICHGPGCVRSKAPSRGRSG
jgi:hypothetical protein